MNRLKYILFLIMLSFATYSCKENVDENQKEHNAEVQTIPDNAKLETASLTIDGMTCAVGCAKAIESKLTNCKGVKEAKVDFDTKVATVVFDANQQNIVSLTSTIEAVAGGDSYKVVNASSVDN